MAAITLTDTSFAGDAAAEMVSRHLLDGDSIAKDAVTVTTNINKERHVPIASTTTAIKDYAAAFSAGADTIALDDVLVAPKKYSVHITVDHTLLDSHWFGAMQSPGVLGDMEPTAALQEWFINQQAARTNVFVDQVLWDGTASVSYNGISVAGVSGSAQTGICDKLESASNVTKRDLSGTQVAITAATEADPAVITCSTTNLYAGDWVTFLDGAGGTWSSIDGNSYQITAVTATTITLGGLDSSSLGTWSAGNLQFINRSNVVEHLQEVYAQIPTEIINDPNFRLVVPEHVQRAYMIAQSNANVGGQGLYTASSYSDNLYQFKLTALNHMKKNSVIASLKDFMFLGTALTDDFNRVSFMNMEDRTGDHTYQYRVDFSLGNGVYDTDLIVWTRPA